MLIDLAMTPLRSTRPVADVCIVGAGPAGILLAERLSAAGQHVVLLESGGLHAADEDQRASRGSSIGLPHPALDRARVRGFGGTSNHWYDFGWFRARPLDPLDLQERPGIPNSGWPLGQEDLLPHWRDAHEASRLGRWDYEVSSYATADRPELPWVGDVFRTAIFKLTEPGAWLDRRDAVVGNEHIDLVTHATVVEIEMSSTSRVGDVVVRAPAGATHRIQASKVVLAAGGLENPRLLLTSRSRHHPAGIGNGHDLVGRFFMEHPHLRAGVVVPSDPDLHDRLGLYRKHDAGEGDVHIQAKISLQPEVVRDEQLLNATSYVRPVSTARGHPAVRSAVTLGRGGWRPRPSTAGHVRNVLRNAGTIGAVASQLAGRRLAGRRSPVDELDLEVMLEQAPNPESRVGLSSRTDRSGVRRLELDWRMTDRERHTLLRTTRLLDEVLRERRLGHVRWNLDDIVPVEPFKPGWHHMGTTRMDPDPEQGVVDVNGRVHGVDNLWIVGSSVFPTVGYANPTLTLLALTARLASHLADAVS